MAFALARYGSLDAGALKKIFRGNITVADGVSLAEREIAEIFARDTGENITPENDMNTGCFGDIVGKCPLCGRNVIRGRYNYGCFGFSDGCTFKMGVSICKKDIPITEAQRLLAEGATAPLRGFISKSGKRFDGRLIIKDGEVVFDFPQKKNNKK